MNLLYNFDNKKLLQVLKKKEALKNEELFIAPLMEDWYLVNTAKSVYSFHEPSQCLCDGNIILTKEKEFLTKEERSSYAKDNYNLIYKACQRINRDGSCCILTADDIESCALVGFTRALNSFDKKKNIKFSTYAMTCMKNELLSFIKKEQKQPVFISFYASNNPDGDICCTLENKIKDPFAFSEDEYIEKVNNRSLLATCLRKLNQFEQQIVLHRFGLDGKDIMTQREFAESFHLSQSYVCKLEQSILNKLRVLITLGGE